jgi:putative addiction module component (TIGR02574 family)
MSPEAERLLEAAGRLSPADRLELTEALLALEAGDGPVLDEEQWAEIRRRSAEFDAGRVQGVPWSVVRDRARRPESEGG